MTQTRIQLHRSVSQALTHGVTNRDWYLRVEVDAAWDRNAPPLTLDALVADVETWLCGLPLETRPDPFSREWSAGTGAARVTLHAKPKPHELRGTPLLIANPSPPVTDWQTRS
jgi:hypothetical protein